MAIDNSKFIAPPCRNNLSVTIDPRVREAVAAVRKSTGMYQSDYLNILIYKDMVARGLCEPFAGIADE